MHEIFKHIPAHVPVQAFWYDDYFNIDGSVRGKHPMTHPSYDSSADYSNAAEVVRGDNQPGEGDGYAAPQQFQDPRWHQVDRVACDPTVTAIQPRPDWERNAAARTAQLEDLARGYSWTTPLPISPVNIPESAQTTVCVDVGSSVANPVATVEEAINVVKEMRVHQQPGAPVSLRTPEEINAFINGATKVHEAKHRFSDAELKSMFSTIPGTDEYKAKHCATSVDECCGNCHADPKNEMHKLVHTLRDQVRDQLATDGKVFGLTAAEHTANAVNDTNNLATKWGAEYGALPSATTVWHDGPAVDRVTIYDDQPATFRVVSTRNAYFKVGQRYTLERHISQGAFEGVANIGFQQALPTGVNGWTNEQLLAVLIDRTRVLNEELQCEENETAIAAMKVALQAFELRASKRMLVSAEQTEANT